MLQKQTRHFDGIDFRVWYLSIQVISKKRSCEMFITLMQFGYFTFFKDKIQTPRGVLTKHKWINLPILLGIGGFLPPGSAGESTLSNTILCRKKVKSHGILFRRGFCFSTSPILIFTLAKFSSVDQTYKISFRRYCIIFVLSLCNGSSAVSDEGKWNYKAVPRERTSSKHPRNWDVSSISFLFPLFWNKYPGNWSVSSVFIFSSPKFLFTKRPSEAWS